MAGEFDACVRRRTRATTSSRAAFATVLTFVFLSLAASADAVGASTATGWVEHGEELAPVSIASSVPLDDDHDASVRMVASPLAS